jgi:hypothetical protein
MVKLFLVSRIPTLPRGRGKRCRQTITGVCTGSPSVYIIRSAQC